MENPGFKAGRSPARAWGLQCAGQRSWFHFGSRGVAIGGKLLNHSQIRDLEESWREPAWHAWAEKLAASRLSGYIAL